MDSETLIALKSAVPFRPFRLVTADGRTFDVTAAGQLWPGALRTLLGVSPSPDHPDGSWVSLDTPRILRTEYLDG